MGIKGLDPANDAVIVRQGWARSLVNIVTNGMPPVRQTAAYVKGPFAIYVDPASPAGENWYALTHVRTGYKCGPTLTRLYLVQMMAARLERLPIPWSEIETPEQFAAYVDLAKLEVVMFRAENKIGG